MHTWPCGNPDEGDGLVPRAANLHGHRGLSVPTVDPQRKVARLVLAPPRGVASAVSPHRRSARPARQVSDREEMNRGLKRALRQATQTIHVQGPEAPPVRGRDQHAVAIVEGEVMDRHTRESSPERHPRRATVKAHGRAKLRPHEQHVRVGRVLDDVVDGAPRLETGRDEAPALPAAEVVSDIDQRPKVILAVAGEAGIGATPLVGRECHPAHPPVRGETGELARQVRPLISAVAGHLDEPVVRAHEQESGVDRRLGDRRDRAVGHVPGDLRRVIGGQVRAVHRPAVPAVVRLEQPVAAEVNDLGVVRRDQDRGVPVEAQG